MPAKPDLTAFAAEHSEVDELRRANGDLQRRLSRAKAKSEDLVQAAFNGAHQAMAVLGGIPAVPAPPRDKRRGHEEVALMHLTDFQGGKETASYNSDVMRQRVLLFCRKAIKIIGIQRAEHPVKRGVVAFGGDMCEGLFQFPQQPFEIDQTIFGQYVTVARLLVEVILFLLGTLDSVTVVAEWGNHGRVGSKRSVVPLSDNFDRMIYELARQLLAGEKRVTWQDCPNDIQHIEVGNYRALLIHGDEFGRMGFASKSTIVQGINRWRSGAHKLNGEPWPFRDVYVGHYHTHGEDAMANGEGAVYWTGSTESDNRYASDRLASSALPSQRLHFIDPERGFVTAQYKVRL